jgi:hypothetical protein
MSRWVPRLGAFGMIVGAVLAIPAVALADNCSIGNFSDCWNTAMGAGLAAGAAGIIGGLLRGGLGGPAGRPGDPSKGGKSDPLEDLIDDLKDIGNPEPGPPSLAEQVVDGVNDFLKDALAEIEQVTDALDQFEKDVRDAIGEAGEDARRGLAEEIAADIERQQQEERGESHTETDAYQQGMADEARRQAEREARAEAERQRREQEQ